MITNNQFRVLAINLLDDENGINEKAYFELKEIARESFPYTNDIFDAVSAQDNRYFLNEDAAQILLEKV
jgi:hypothetical protein